MESKRGRELDKYSFSRAGGEDRRGGTMFKKAVYRSGPVSSTSKKKGLWGPPLKPTEAR